MTQISLLKDASGRYVFVDSIVPGAPDTLMGYPIYEDGNMPAYSTTDSFGLAFGNFRRGYVIVDRIGTRITRDNLTNKPFVGLYATRRVGGGVCDYRAIKFLKFGNA